MHKPILNGDFVKIQNKLKNPVVFGTLLLSFAGILSKIIGFFYRIFLSRTIGAEGLGIYQLIFPISTICFAITVSGISTSLSKFVAEYKERDPSAPKRLLRFGLLLSSLLSIGAMLILFRYSSFIAANILLEPRCEPLIPILALSIPLASFHSCIHGYYYGKKKAGIPAASSFIEQFVRVIFGRGHFVLRHVPSDLLWGMGQKKAGPGARSASRESLSGLLTRKKTARLLRAA